MIKEWLDSYKPRNEQDARDALREIMQEIALAGALILSSPVQIPYFKTIIIRMFKEHHFDSGKAIMSR
ncbi:hypothetical protein [Sphingobacterium sp. FBM7-1]|uniref:hypothetical protein n=1 Tax=Sphingobacterium sp. FBM7-1 TaxID=2886688 RepID=UPI001D1018ED|nr:hypothetical protein [Sphingobacterium sp. FBM7-1]MCC2598249.1 hypothetical protein [Sphingobacterium sp. FBM7-1]